MTREFETKRGMLKIEFSLATEKRKIFINGIQATKINKTEYVLIDSSINDGKEVNIRVYGNIAKGMTVNVDGFSYVILEAVTWYELALCIFFLAFNLAWGNTPKLVNVMPIVGGAIGGAISGLCFAFGLAFSRIPNKKIFRVLVILGFGLLGFLICLILGLTITSLLRK